MGWGKESWFSIRGLRGKRVARTRLAMANGMGDEWTPSRGRDLGDLERRAVGLGYQPAGAGLRPLLDAPCNYVRPPDAHARLAVSILTGRGHPLAAPPPLRDYWQEAVQGAAQFQTEAELVEVRTGALARIWERARALEEAQREWAAALPPALQGVMGHLNMPLMAELLEQCGYPNQDFCARLSRGRPIVGDIEPGGALRPKQTGRAQAVEEVMQGRGAANTHMFDTFASSGDAELDSASWSKVEKELGLGTMMGPFYDFDALCASLTKEGCPCASVDEVLCSRQVPIWEVRAGGRKCRNIVDMKRSGLNLACRLHEAYGPDGIDALSAIIDAQVRAGIPGARGAWLGCPSDYSGAYRQCPLLPEHFKFAVVVCWDAELGRPALAYYKAQPFGSSAAPGNFSEITVAMSYLCAKLAKIAIPTWVDDTTMVEPAGLVYSARDFWLGLNEAIGWQIDLVKSPLPEPAFRSLGIWVRCPHIDTGVPLAFSVLPEKTDRLRSDLDAVADMGPGALSKLRGRLYNIALLSWSSFSRALIRRFVPGATPATKQMRRTAATWFQGFLDSLGEREAVWTHRRRRLIVSYSDACLANPDPDTKKRTPQSRAGIGVVVLPAAWAENGKVVGWVAGESSRRAFCDAPRAIRVPDVIGKETLTPLGDIAALEAAGVLATLASFPSLLSAKDGEPPPLWVHFVDNTVVHGALVHGASSSTQVNRLVACVAKRVSDLRVVAYFEWVPSKSMFADPESRQCLSPVERPALPSVDPWGRPWVCSELRIKPAGV